MEQRPYRRTTVQKKENFFHILLEFPFVRPLLFYILPFIIINSTIFFLVTTKPKYEVVVAPTNDYRTTEVTFTIKSYMPLKTVTITLNSEPLNLVKVGNRSYRATISTNGILDIYMKNFNGMSLSEFEVIDILDDDPPDIESYEVEEGILTIVLNDTQSGIDYASLHAVNSQGEIKMPLSVDKNNRTAVFEMEPEGMTLSIKDMSGNEYQPSFSVVTNIDTDNNPDTLENQVMIQ